MAGSRRQQGEGGYRYREAEKRHEFTVDLGWVNGKRKRKSFYGKTQGEARDKRDKWLRANPGLLPVDDQLTVEGWCAIWLASNPRARADTIGGYESTLRNHVYPTLGRHALSKLKKAHVDRLLADKVAEGYKPSTVKKIRDVLRAALNAAVKDERVLRNVAALCDPPVVGDPDRRALEPDEATRLIAHGRDGATIYWPLWAVALHTGLRQSELLGLGWDDVDLDRRVAVVRRRMRRYKGDWTVAEVKSRASRRAVPLTTAAVEALKAQRRLTAEWRLAWGDWWSHPGHPEVDWIFRRPDGGEPLPVNTACRDDLDRALADLGIPRVVFHELRHTTGSLMLNDGIDIFVVSKILGHASVAVTERYYAHGQSQAGRAAADRLDRVLGGL